MLKLGKRIFIKEPFVNEAEIDLLVLENSEYIFGPSSIFLPKALIRTEDGAGTIPDGFAIDLATKQWFIVEAELVKHPVWNHIAPQIAKQGAASKRTPTKRLIAKAIVEKVKNDKALLEMVAAEGIQVIHLHQVVSEILEKNPIVGIPIDDISEDLKGWAETIRYEVRLWKITKYAEFGHPENIIYEFPEESRPSYDTKEELEVGSGAITQYDVKLLDLVQSEFLKIGQSLNMSYKPKKGSKQTFEAIVREDGTLKVLDKIFTSPSYAAIFCIQQAGSLRKTDNGWRSWKDSGGKPLIKIREEYLQTKSQE